MQDLPIRDRLAQEPVPKCEPFHEVFRSANDDVEREIVVEDRPDSNGLRGLVPRAHDHKKIHVTIGPGPAAGMRTEEQDPIRVEHGRDLTGNVQDPLARNVTAHGRRVPSASAIPGNAIHGLTP